MIFKHFLLDVNKANAFIVACEKTHKAMLIDAGAMSDEIVDYIEENNLNLRKVFITHDQYDHTDGLGKFIDKYKAAAYCGSGKAGGFRTRSVLDGDCIRVGEIEAKVVVTPGHTVDGISLVMDGHVFTGDALFSRVESNSRAAEKTEVQINHIQENILNLPEEYQIHTGHGPSTTVAQEKVDNPYFKAEPSLA